MCQIKFLIFSIIMFLLVGVIDSKNSCASFMVDTNTVPASDGYNATLNFTISYNCKGEGSWVKKVVVFTTNEWTLRVPDCQVHYNKSRVLSASGCTYDPNTLTVTVTKHIEGDQTEVWTLVGTLNNGRRFNRTVMFQTTYVQESDSTSAIVVAVTISMILFICLAAVAITLGVRKFTQDVKMRHRVANVMFQEETRSNRTTVAEISDAMYRGSNVSLMISNDIYDAAGTLTSE